MALPLENLLEYNKNRYELTCAAIKRCIQISLAGDEEFFKSKGKVTAVALKQILDGRIKYQIEK